MMEDDVTLDVPPSTASFPVLSSGDLERVAHVRPEQL
jgi:hypothetical protein